MSKNTAPPTMQLVTAVTDLEQPEVAAIERAGGDPNLWIGLTVGVPHMTVVGQHADGALVWQATFLTPPKFFRFQTRSALVLPNGQQAAAVDVSRDALPQIRLVVNRASLAAGIVREIEEIEAKPAGPAVPLDPFSLDPFSLPDSDPKVH